MGYREAIERIMSGLECDTVPASAVEAWARLQYGTLDHLSPAEFEEVIEDAIVQACMAGDELNAMLVGTYA